MDNDIKIRFGLAIKQYRLCRKLSQEKLAELTGLHQTYISEVERGTRNISLVNIYKISKALNVSLTELFSWVEK